MKPFLLTLAALALVGRAALAAEPTAFAPDVDANCIPGMTAGAPGVCSLPGYRWELAGTYRATQESFSSLLTVMVVAVFVYSFIPRPNLWFVIASRIVLMPLIAGLSRWAGVATRWCLDSGGQARFLAVVPLHPVSVSTGAVRRCPVVPVMAVLERAALHPRWVLPTHGGQRIPQFFVEHHGGKAPICVHLGARVPMLVTAGSRC